MTEETMSELQTEEVVETPTEEIEVGSELAPDSSTESENKPEDSITENAQKAINRQHFKYRKEQRAREAAERERDELKKKLGTPAQTGDVTIPSMPDSWDDNYDEKVRQRDDAIRRKAASEEQSRIVADTEAKRIQEEQRESLERSEKLNNGFLENATKLKINSEKLEEAQNAVIEYGVTPGIATALLQDPDGPLMVQHLAANPLDLHDLVTADPVLAGMKLAQIKTKADVLRPKQSEAPPPPDTLDGRGAGEKGYEDVPGAKFF